MGILRDLFRIGRQADDGVPDRPTYPPEDELTFGFEEVFVSLALLILSYLVLSTPWFSIGRASRFGTRLNPGGWMEAVKRVRYVRNANDLKLWWQQLRHRDSVNGRNFDPERWNQMIGSRHSVDSYHSEMTVRTKGGRGGSAPSTPLRSLFFRRTSSTNDTMRQKMHASSSDGYLVDTPARAERPLYKQNSGISEGGKSFHEEDFVPETDHDRFEKAWQSQIRFAEYRRLVLPPECKLVGFTSDGKEAGHSVLENLLDESRCNKIISYVRNVLEVLHGIFGKLFSKEGILQFSHWAIKMIRYRLRKKRGLSVDDDDETDDEDDGSVASLATQTSSNIGKRPAQTQTKPKLPDMTPVISNQRKSLKGFTSLDMMAPPPPPLPEVVRRISPKPKGTFEAMTPKEESPGNENDSSFMNVPQSASSDKATSFVPKFGTSATSEMADDATFVSALGLEYIDFSARSHDVPSSVDQTAKHQFDVSPLPMKVFQKPKKKDALENYRNPDMSSIGLPSLKPPGPKPERISPMPSPKVGAVKTTGTNLVDTANMNFFDTANSNRQLRDMSRAVPIPDANGYIVGDEFLGSSYTPLLVFVNSRSGPQQGSLLITQFRRLLNPIQVWDLANGGPEKVLKSFSVLSRFQILVCGGDGTVSWVISALEKMDLKRWPPIGILPLGTGNDLARIHGWGGGYNNESLLYILRQISEAYISMLDLWELDITSTSKKGKQKKEVRSFMNYLGVGVDAQAALQVHQLRESKPKLFFSRFFNKAWYAIAGGEEAIKSSCANLSQKITLIADGVEIPLPPDSQGIIFLNIDSYSGGVPMWSKGLKPQKMRVRRYSEGDFLNPNASGLTRNDSIEDLAELDATRELTACDLPSSCQDGLLDVVSIRGAFHLGQIRVGLSNAQLICQCRQATVTLKKKIAIQIDGEPWRQNPSTLSIIRKPDRANMLNRSAEDNGGVETEVTKLLNWANERDVIDPKQYALLMEEFNRRIQRKKRTQKEKGNGFSFVG